MNISGNQLLEYVISDFECAWNGIESNPGQCARGNFLFARQAMILLELICRICKSDESGDAINNYSNELNNIDNRYFTEFPKNCWKRRTAEDFDFPKIGISSYNTVLAALFDLIRNGQSHQYQQLFAELSDKTILGIGLTGAEHGCKLINRYEQTIRNQHLSIERGVDKKIWLIVRTDLLYSDFKGALYRSKLMGLNLNPIHINPRKFDFDSNSVFKALSMKE